MVLLLSNDDDLSNSQTAGQSGTDGETSTLSGGRSHGRDECVQHGKCGGSGKGNNGDLLNLQGLLGDDECG